jgi:hypothetical protein
MISKVLLVIIFTGCLLPPPSSLRVLEVHINGIRGICIHIIESKIHISYLRNHDSTLMLSSIICKYHSFQPSSISLLRVGNTFSIISPFDITNSQKKLSWYLIDWQLSIPIVNGHAYSYALPTLWRWGHKLGFKRHRESRYSSQCFRKLWFRHYYQIIIFTGRPSFMGARGSQTVSRVLLLISSSSKFKNLYSTLMLVFYYFYMSSHSNAQPYHC